jgi:hypothetical protein
VLANIWNVTHDNREVVGNPNVLRFFLPQNFAGTQDQNEKRKMSMVNVALGSLKYSDEWMGEYPFQSTTP